MPYKIEFEDVSGVIRSLTQIKDTLAEVHDCFNSLIADDPDSWVYMISLRNLSERALKAGARIDTLKSRYTSNLKWSVSWVADEFESQPGRRMFRIVHSWASEDGSEVLSNVSGISYPENVINLIQKRAPEDLERVSHFVRRMTMYVGSYLMVRPNPRDSYIIFYQGENHGQ